MGCCDLAQYPRSRRDVPLAAAPANPRAWRDGPARMFEPTYEDVIGFDVTVGATSQESKATRNIYGAFRLDRVAGRCGTAATDSMRLFVGADSDDTLTAGELDLNNDGNQPIVSDAATRFKTGYDLTTLYTSFPVGTIFCHGLTRLLLVFVNTSAGAQVAVGNLHLTHLNWVRPDTY
jgi:hypothetical protein